MEKLKEISTEKLAALVSVTFIIVMTIMISMGYGAPFLGIVMVGLIMAGVFGIAFMIIDMIRDN